jgi:ketosteroid isomerase-like protein
MKRIRFLKVFASLAAAAAFAPAAMAQTPDAVSETPLSTGDVYQVRTSIDKWMEALSARDPNAFSNYVMSDLQGAYQGAIADYDGASFERSLKLTLAGAADKDSKDSWSNDIEEVVGSGDMAVVRSTRTFTHTLAGGRATSLKMRLLEVYRRFDDGTWRMARFFGFAGV